MAGIGNSFFGDDAFGLEVVRRLAGRRLPEGVLVHDFGIRALDLAHALELCEAVILVHSGTNGHTPGTVSVRAPGPARNDVDRNGEGLTPERVIAFVPPGARPAVVRSVSCEPASLDPQPDGMLSPAVQQAVEPAMDVVEKLVHAILEGAVAGA